jgi:hypothetical protein
LDVTFFISFFVIIIVKCLFILAAVFLHILAISRREKGRRGDSLAFFCGNQNRIFSLPQEICWRNTEFFWCGKILWSRDVCDQAARQFFFWFAFMVTCLCILRCERIYFSVPFVSTGCVSLIESYWKRIFTIQSWNIFNWLIQTFNFKIHPKRQCITLLERCR